MKVDATATGDLVNQVTPTGSGTCEPVTDGSPANPEETDRCTTIDHVKEIVVSSANSCVQDSANLHYEITKLNVPDGEKNLPLTAQWIDPNGNDVGGVITLAGGEGATGDLLWPGMVVQGGTAVGWPGYRVVNTGEDVSKVPAEDLFEGPLGEMVLDPSLPSYQWRGDMQVAFEINPATTVTLAYPDAEHACVLPAVDATTTTRPPAPSTTTTSPDLGVDAISTTTPAPASPAAVGSKPLAYTGTDHLSQMITAGAAAILAGLMLLVLGTRARRKRAH